MTSFVYIVAVGGDDGPFSKPVKIGRTDNPEKRIEQLRDGSPFGIAFAEIFKVSGARSASKLKSRMHDLFDGRLLSHGWFDVDPDIAIKTLRELGVDHV